MRCQNSDVGDALREAVYGTVSNAVSNAVFQTVHGAVWGAVDRAVDMVGWNAEFWALEDPDHPALQDFRRPVGEI